jgi:hypothetical protein
VLAVPGLVLIAATACLLLALPLGLDPLWRVEPLTLAEAAALRDNGEIVRLIQQGEDPNRPGTVRAELLRNDPIVITPLEAAVGIDRPDVLEVLLDHGATMNEAMWTRLVCFAEAIDADDARSFLESHRPAGTSDACDHVATPW